MGSRPDGAVLVIELVSYTHTEHGRWRFTATKGLMQKVHLEHEQPRRDGGPRDVYAWVTVKVMSTDGPGRLGLWIMAGFLVNPNEGRGILSQAVEEYLMEQRIGVAVSNLGKEHQPPAGWEAKVLAEQTEARLDEARNLIGDMQRVINGHMGIQGQPGYEVARRLIAARVNAYFSMIPVRAPTPDPDRWRHEMTREVAIKIINRASHGPNGRDGDGPCDADCIKCEAERVLERTR